MLTDSYKIIEDGFVSLSGKSNGVSGVAADVIASITGGDVSVEFKPIDDYAKKLVSDKLGKEYVENDEGFIVEAGENVTVYADTDRAKLFAACSVKDKCENDKMNRGVWWSYPSVPHRSLRIFLPPKDDLDYFYKLIDMLVHLGYNSILLEICGALEFKRHPEINKAWIEYCASVNEYPEKYNYVGSAYYRTKNSVHTCNAGGGVYSQEEMKEIVKYCADRFIEIVPEVPSLSHSEYICVAHPELRECDDEPYAATACPSNPELNKLVFDLYDEVIEVFGCKSLHIGHDEWWVMNVCDKCKDKDPIDLYVNNVLENYEYLKSKGVKTYMWADKLTAVKDKKGEEHGAARKDIYALPRKEEPVAIEIMGKKYQLYDRYWFKAPEWVKEIGFHQVIADMRGCSEKLPPDIMYCNWYYAYDPEIADNVYEREGKDMIYGNAVPSALNNYKMRFEHGCQGISVSNWAETSEYNMAEWGAPYELGYGSIICWNHDRTEYDFKINNLEAFNGLYKLRNRDVLSGPHLEVTHTSVVPWADGNKCVGEMSLVDTDFLTMGNYEVTYTDGRVEKFPVMYSLNVSNGNVRMERCISSDNYAYGSQRDYIHTASLCDIAYDDEYLWYTAVMPLTGEVADCKYVPRNGFEDYIKVKSINVK